MENDANITNRMKITQVMSIESISIMDKEEACISGLVSRGKR